MYECKYLSKKFVVHNIDFNEIQFFDLHMRLHNYLYKFKVKPSLGLKCDQIALL